MDFRIYVAAPFSVRGEVRAIHTQMRERGLTPTATWVDYPGDGAEHIPTRQEALAAIAANDADLLSSHAVLVIGRDGLGAEMFCEVTRALMSGIPCVWVGRRALSAYRPGVMLVDSVDVAMGRLERLGYLAREWSGVDADEWLRQAIWAWATLDFEALMQEGAARWQRSKASQ